MKITKISKGSIDHTWDISVSPSETYLLSNGCVSHNSSSQLANATNGVEPPRGFISEKSSKDGTFRQVVPEFYRLKNKYDLLWDQKSPVGYLKVMAVLQKWADQTISTNTSYNPENYENEKIPLKDLMQHIVMAYKYGLKTLYYQNTHDGAGEDNTENNAEAKSENKQSEPTELSALPMQDDACDGCVL